MTFSPFSPTNWPARCSTRCIAGLAIASLSGLLHAQTQKLTVPTSQPMSVELVKHVPLHQGQAIRARLRYPVYVDNELAIPAGTMFEGNIVSLAADKHRRVQGKLEGDFTPFRKPTVAFDAITFPGGTTYSIVSQTAADGAPILHLAAAAPHARKGFIKAQFAMAKQNARDQIATITGAGKGDRALQFLYRQLPYHPQRIETGTAWTVNLASPLEVPAQPDPPSTVAQRETPGIAKKMLGSTAAADPNAPDVAEHSGAELLHAYLTKTISSASAKPGDTFTACVTQPVYDGDHRIAVPEGAILVGTVTQAKPAKSFGRKGKLRFSFRELQMPDGFQQDVNGMLAGADAARAADLQIDAEGGVQPKQKNRTVVPLALSILASRALDSDGSQAANGTVASNGFGIVGRIAGIAAAPRGVAAGIGFYGAGLAVFNRWIAPGQDVTFVKATRIDVLTTPARPRLADSVQPGPAETAAER
jgi:hypothetical protein